MCLFKQIIINPIAKGNKSVNINTKQIKNPFKSVLSASSAFHYGISQLRRKTHYKGSPLTKNPIKYLKIKPNM